MRARLFATLALFAVAGCDWTKPKAPGVDKRSAAEKLANARRLKQACGSAETYDRLKALTFDEAEKVGTGASPVLDRIAADATIRMENPVAKSRDEQLDITVCEGHLVIDLPPGVQDAFGGARRVEADVEYSAQQAVDGSGLVYQMKGAEPIIYRLAALTLPNAPGQQRARVEAIPLDQPEQPQLADATPVAKPQPVETVAPVRRPALDPPERPAPIVRPVPPPVRDLPERAVATARPSFNCGAVRSRVLRMVCSDPGLAAQDRSMSSAFYAALADGDEETRAALRESRDRFIAFRNRCATASCIAQAYEDRLDEIRDIAAGR